MSDESSGDEKRLEGPHCLMTFLAQIAIPRYHARTGQPINPEITDSRPAKQFLAPLGMPHLAVLEGLGYCMSHFLYQDKEMAERQVALLNGTLRRLEFYVDEDEDGHIVLKTRDPGAEKGG